MRWAAAAVAGVLITGCGGGEVRPAATLAPAAGPANAPERIPAMADRAGSHRERLVVPGRPGHVRARGWVSGATLSPDGQRLALGVGDAGRVQIAGLRRLRHEALIPTTAGAPLVELVWPAAERLLGVSGGDPRVASVLVDVDPAAGRVRSERSLDAAVLATHAGPLGLTAVLGPPDDIEEARLVHIDLRGRSRSWRLPGVAAGTLVDRDAQHLLRERGPGLAVSDADARAFVVAPGRGVRVVEVDLRTGRTVAHDVRPSRGPLARLADALVPEAEAKAGERAWRQAHWLGGGRLAVTGVDEDFDHATGTQRTVPVGLRLVDVRSWEQQVLDRHATYAVPVGDGLAVGDGVGDRHGVRFDPDRGGRGVRVFAADGTLRWRHGAGTALTPRFTRGRVLHALDHRARRMRSLDLVTGRQIAAPVPPGRVDAPLP